MKTKSLLLLWVLLSCMTAWGQRDLNFKDVTTDLNVFSGKDDEAGMVFSCPTSIPLTFESSHDKEVDVYQTEVKGDNTVYYIRFQVGRKYRGRKLTVITSDFNPLVFTVDLAPKELKQYSLFDPDAAFVYGCYYEYRKRGADYFQEGMYAEAREQYATAKECSDCPADSDLDNRIADIDSISSYLSQAERYKEILDYTQASSFYLKILLLNPGDKAVQAQRLATEYQYSADCNRYANSAETYYDDGDYEKALELYQKVLDLNCFNAVVATERIALIQRKLNSRKQRATVLNYEFGTTTPIGISIGTYKNRRFGGYFTLAFHPDVFKAIRKEYDETKDFEADISFGWTTTLVSKIPVWLFFGPGYTLNGEFLPKLDENDQPTDEMKFKMYHAISPELGLLGKWKFLVLRYTFQYRFAFSKDYEDKIKKTKHSFGIGVCF